MNRRRIVLDTRNPERPFRYADEYGQCDHCDGPYLLGGDDHNPETGNHHECERGQE